MSTIPADVPPNLPTLEEPPFLDLAEVQNPEHATFSQFLSACQHNDSVLAFQLASDQEPAALTVGLNLAIRWLHLALAHQLLLNGVQWDAQTAIYASDTFDAIKLLLDFGFNVNTGLLGGGTLLGMVVARNDWLAIRFLLRHGANPNLGPPRLPQGPLRQIRPVPNSGATLNQAAATGTPQIFALLLEHGAVLSNSIALHRAAGVPARVPPGERIPMLEYLVGLGLDINAMDDAIKIAEDGRGQRGSPLQYAVVSARVKEAKWLLEHGADPDKKTSYGISARDRAKKYSAEHEMSILLREF